MSKAHSVTQRLPIILWVIVILNLFIGIFALTYNMFTQEKVVYVDAVRLISKYKEVEAVRKDLNAKSEIWQANLDTLRAEAEKAIAKYNNNKNSSSPRELKLMEELVQSKQDQFLTYQQTVKEQYQKQDQEISGKILQKVNDYIKKYGEEKGFTIILAATQYGNIAYADKSLDITEEVLAGLNKEYQIFDK
jgi:outer membrane protein